MTARILLANISPVRVMRIAFSIIRFTIIMIVLVKFNRYARSFRPFRRNCNFFRKIVDSSDRFDIGVDTNAWASESTKAARGNYKKWMTNERDFRESTRAARRCHR